MRRRNESGSWREVSFESFCGEMAASSIFNDSGSLVGVMFNAAKEESLRGVKSWRCGTYCSAFCFFFFFIFLNNYFFFCFYGFFFVYFFWLFFFFFFFWENRNTLLGRGVWGRGRYGKNTPQDHTASRDNFACLETWVKPSIINLYEHIYS